MGDYEQIVFETIEPGIAKLTLNRPDRLNSYTPVLCAEMLDALQRYHDDDELRVLILTGAGRGFCSGGDITGDLAEINARRDVQLATFRRLRAYPQKVNQAISRIDKPVIAMVNGVAVSGGLTLALVCDYRIAARSATFGDVASAAGLLPDEGGAWAFPRAMGLDRAQRMVWLGELYDSAAAHELGLVSEVVADDELVARTLEFCRALAARPPHVVATTKWLLRKGYESTFEQSLGDSAVWAMWSNAQPDSQAALAAFREERAARRAARERAEAGSR